MSTVVRWLRAFAKMGKRAMRTLNMNHWANCSDKEFRELPPPAVLISAPVLYDYTDFPSRSLVGSAILAIFNRNMLSRVSLDLPHPSPGLAFKQGNIPLTVPCVRSRNGLGTALPKFLPCQRPLVGTAERREASGEFLF